MGTPLRQYGITLLSNDKAQGAIPWWALAPVEASAGEPKLNSCVSDFEQTDATRNSNRSIGRTTSLEVFRRVASVGYIFSLFDRAGHADMQFDLIMYSIAPLLLGFLAAIAILCFNRSQSRRRAESGSNDCHA